MLASSFLAFDPERTFGLTNLNCYSAKFRRGHCWTMQPFRTAMELWLQVGNRTWQTDFYHRPEPRHPSVTESVVLPP